MSSEKGPMVEDIPHHGSDVENGTHLSIDGKPDFGLDILAGKADLGLKFLAEKGEVVEYTAEEENAVRWKIDLYVLPILALTYGLQYLDKITLSYSAVYGIRKDLHLVGQQYSWSNSLFYFGYLVGEIPANLLMQKLPIGKLAAINILIWGVLVMLCAVAKNFAGLAVLRFLMGLFEAIISPAWVQLTGMFWKAGEQGARVAIWYSMVGVAAIVGGLLSYGIGHIHTGIELWKYPFLICGAVTVLWSGVIFFFLPDSPVSARFFNEREKSIAVERLRTNRTGLKNPQFKWKQAFEAFKDPQCWIIALWAGSSQILNIGGSFLPLIIKAEGFSTLETTLLTLPVGGVEIVAMAAAALMSSYLKKGRTVIMFIVATPTLIGCALLAKYTTNSPKANPWVRCVGVWLLLCIPASYAILLSLISSNIAGTSKKVTTSMAVFILWCVGNIVSPQLFLASEAATGYHTAIRSLLVSICIVQALTVMLGVYYFLENKRRDRALAAASPEVLAQLSVANEEFLDRTDKEDFLRFRYNW